MGLSMKLVEEACLGLVRLRNIQDALELSSTSCQAARNLVVGAKVIWGDADGFLKPDQLQVVVVSLD